MADDASALDRMQRDDLIELAGRLGVSRPELLTRVELKDEIIRKTETDEGRRRRSRGWLGVARDLLASVVEQGLHMPDAAALIRGEVRFDAGLKQYPPVATVTLAEIYASQGHLERAVAMLDEVLDREPEHQAARTLRARLAGNDAVAQKLGVDDAAEAHGESEGESEGEAHAIEGELVHAIDELEEQTPPSQEPTLRMASEPPPAPVIEPEPSADALITIHDIGGHLFVYWEVTAETRARAQPVVRLALFQPTWDGAQRGERDFPVEGARGSRLLVGMERGVVARAALGWQSASGFLPVAVAVELDGYMENGPSVRWSPPGRPRPHSAAYERALAGYVREVAERGA